MPRYDANPEPRPVVQYCDEPDHYVQVPAGMPVRVDGPNGRDADLASEGEQIITDEQRESLTPSLDTVRKLLKTFPAHYDEARLDDDGAPPAAE